MMARFVTLALFFCLAGRASAYDISIRSGEHDTFSRLVLTIPASTQWTAISKTEQHKLSFFPPPQDIDTSNVFDRIGRSRIRSVTNDAGNALVIDTNCHCALRAFLWKPDRLVVDILDAAPTQNPTTQPRSKRVSDFLDESIFRPSHTPKPSLAALEAALIEQIETSIATGLVHGSGQSGIASEIPSGPRSNTPELPGLSAATALTDPKWDTPTIQSGNCLQGAALTPWDWQDGRPLQEQISRILDRKKLLSGSLDDDARNDLAKLYVSFGYGVEAKQLLGNASASDPETNAMVELIALLDTEYQPADSSLFCDVQGEFWHFLTASAPPHPADHVATQIANTYLRLPRPLADHLASRFHRQLTKAGLNDLAQAVLAARNATPPEPIMSLQEIIRSHELSAAQQIAQITRSLSQANHNARYLEETSLLASESVAFEFRQNPMSQDIARLAFENRLGTGHFSEAFAALEREYERMPELANMLFTHLAAEADMPIFVEFGARWQDYSLNDSASLAVIERFGALGLDVSTDSTSAKAVTVEADSASPRTVAEDEGSKPQPPTPISPLGQDVLRLEQSQRMRAELEASLSENQ